MPSFFYIITDLIIQVNSFYKNKAGGVNAIKFIALMR